MPTAATLLTEQVKQHLDSALISEASATNTSNSTTRTLQPSGIRMLKIQRAAPTQGDYSTMTVEQRAAVMGGNQLTLPPTCELAGKHLVIIDDSRITGSHEQCIERVSHAHERPAGTICAVLYFLRAVLSALDAWDTCIHAVQPAGNHLPSLLRSSYIRINFVACMLTQHLAD